MVVAAHPGCTQAPRRKLETLAIEEMRIAPRWKVILHNDNTTTFEFVTGLLISLFHKDLGEAERLTWEVHDEGAAVVEITSLERGELYVEQVHSLARPRGYPLAATLEPE
jgi:ATP-dependent Clp protease adaptor protein ClpS